LIEPASQEWLYATSVSIGIAYYAKHGFTANELLEAVEGALKEAKTAGKN